MAKKIANTVTFNLRLSLESAVQNSGGGVNYYHAGWETVLPGNEPDALAEKLAALGVDDAEIKVAVKAANAAIRAHK